MAPRAPFSFPDFDAQAAAAPAELCDAAVGDDGARAAAFAEGVAEGRRLASESIAAAEAAALARVADALAAEAGEWRKVNNEARTELTTAAADFLAAYCEGFAEARELETAASFLRQLAAAEPDRAPARLAVSRASRTRLGARLEELIETTGVADFVTVEEDPKLAPGEVLLAWRGGFVSRRRQDIRAAVTGALTALNEER